MKDQFLEGKIWIHITTDDIPLLNVFQEEIPGIKFCSGDELDSGVMLSALRGYEELWLRCSANGCSYIGGTNPRKSDCWTLNPQLYKHGEIVDLEDFIGKKLTIEENEFTDLFGEI